ncbi:hypothetical protein A4A49_61560 [Nicotiana attenuata]|uniref:Uncharacterized protein n=1 Tax=Nicotiana attenuata TaxID=49451 RepID=A0A1J6J461_NICAT|nr:hypothetical protein A4A49_61560 [Nicotiana attenuata]
MKKFTSSNYRSWWARAHGSLLEDHLQFLMNTVEPIRNTLQDRNNDVLVIDKLPALKSMVVEVRTCNGPMLHKEVQREEIHAPVDKSLIPFNVVVDASNKRLSQEESDISKGDQCWENKMPKPEGVVERKLKGSDTDKVFELEENTKVILEAMDGDDVDIYPLRNLLESIFKLAALYNKIRSALSEKVEETAISEVEVHLTNAKIEEEEKAREVPSIRQSLVTMKEKIAKLREKEKNLEALLGVAEKEVKEANLGASTARKEYDAWYNALLIADDLADLEKKKKKKYLEAMLKDLANYKLCLD